MPRASRTAPVESNEEAPFVLAVSEYVSTTVRHDHGTRSGRGWRDELQWNIDDLIGLKLTRESFARPKKRAAPSAPMGFHALKIMIAKAVKARLSILASVLAASMASTPARPQGRPPG